MNKKSGKMKCYAILFIFFVSTTKDILAVNYVTVATIGSKPQLHEIATPQQMIDEVIRFWREKFQQVIPDKPDLIVLTENCDYPQGLSTEQKKKYFQVRKNQVLDYFASVARNNRCYIAFGMERLAEDSMWRNSSVLLDREGKVVGIYDKNFPAIYELEAGIKAGNNVPVFNCDFGRVVSAICFDLNFDELRQKYISAKPNIILFSSMYHGGDALQSNWAYSCRSFFVGSMAFRDIPSEIRNPLGEIVATNTNYYDFAVTRINLDYRLAHLDQNWEKLRALKEKYKEEVIISDPGKLGAVLITSEHKTVSAEDMTKEFGIELLDDYFNSTRKLRLQSLGRNK